MVVALWILVGLGVGWAGGRLLAVKRGGSAGDVAAGVLGSVSAAGRGTRTTNAITTMCAANDQPTIGDSRSMSRARAAMMSVVDPFIAQDP